MAPHQCYLQCVLLEFPAEKKQAQDRGKFRFRFRFPSSKFWDKASRRIKQTVTWSWCQRLTAGQGS